MRNESKLFLLCSFFLILHGCAPTIAPNGYLPTSEDTLSDTYGGWTEIQIKDDLFSGELISISTDSIFVLSDNQLDVVLKRDVIYMRLDRYDSKVRDMSGWTLAGMISTVSHGAGLFLSMPIWFLTGVSSSSMQSKEPIIEYPNTPFDLFTPYSRFPQGLPVGLERNSLKSKKYSFTRRKAIAFMV